MSFVTASRISAAFRDGPVRYLATLIGVNDNTMMRWFILTDALLLDPGAVLLLLAATSDRGVRHTDE